MIKLPEKQHNALMGHAVNRSLALIKDVCIESEHPQREVAIDDLESLSRAIELLWEQYREQYIE